MHPCMYNTWLIGPTGVNSINVILISLTNYARITSVTIIHTDSPCYIGASVAVADFYTHLVHAITVNNVI